MPLKRIFPNQKGVSGGSDLYELWLEHGGEGSFEEFLDNLFDQRSQELSLQFSGRSISKGYMCPNIFGYSPKSFGKKLPNRYELKKIVFQTNSPKNKIIKIRTTDGEDIYSFLADSNKELNLSSIIIEKDKTINVFVDGPDVMIGNMNINLELVVSD